MNKEEMPKWMMEYVANIGTDECYKEFRNLSEEYHANRDRYKPVGSPVQKYAHGGDPYRETQTRLVEIKPEDFENRKINEEYKEKSLELAGKYGYKRPAYEYVFSPKIKEIRKNFATQKVRTNEDLFAETAHRNYQLQHPDKAQKYKDNLEKYTARELKEIDLEKYHEHYGQRFDKAQDRFDKIHEKEAKKGDKSFDNVTQDIGSKFQQNAKDITEPDPANPFNPDAKNSRHIDEPEPDPNNNASEGSKKAPKETEKSTEDTVKNKSDITQNSLSSKFFNSLGIKDEKLKKEDKKSDKSETTKSISSKFFTPLGIDQNKLEQLSNKSTKQDKEIDTEKQNPSERFFKDIGFTVHNSDITKNRNTDKSTTANKVSISFSFDKASTKSPDKSVDLDKD